MKRVRSILFCTIAAALLATTAFAEPPQHRTQPGERSAHTRDTRPRYANTAERWRGRPHLRRAGAAHPASPTGGEVVYEHLPSVNFLLQGHYGGAFAAPRF